jgi:hypothetical protein
MGTKTIAGEAHLVAGATMSASVNTKHNLSRQHLKTAQYFAEQSAKIENKGHEADDIQHRAYVTGAVTFAVHFLEASINELYLESQEKYPYMLKGLTDQVLQMLTVLWDHIERSPTLDKYQTVLRVANAEQFDKEKPPYQDTASLVALRDALVHYKPQWSNEPGRHHKLETRLRDKFPLNALARKGSLWLPHQCLGAGGAKWAVDVVTAFTDKFCERLKIPKRTVPPPLSKIQAGGR